MNKPIHPSEFLSKIPKHITDKYCWSALCGFATGVFEINDIFVKAGCGWCNPKCKLVKMPEINGKVYNQYPKPIGGNNEMSK